jgi:hypothetical protein
MNSGKFYNNLYVFRQQLKDNSLFVLSFLYIRLYLIAITGFNIFLWLLVYSININFTQDLIVLHYNVNFGVDMIGSVGQLYVIPLLYLIIIVLNILIIFSIIKYKYFKFIAHILLLTSLVVGVFLLISLAFIYLVNFK